MPSRKPVNVLPASPIHTNAVALNELRMINEPKDLFIVPAVPLKKYTPV